ncbi:MAG: helix-turn-helix domain-containing protein [Prevotellaceae bacterium]|jgi:transcriptional regulator with XRE-family HTH domain|nr:helix-turn-helix domain-containing protein [Prevotellaceae bacterium]
MNAKKIHVGNYVKNAVKQSDYSLSDVARKIGVSRQKLNGWLNRDDMYVKDLFTISEAINYDLVKFFCIPEDNEQETKVILHIEVEKNKINDVLKIIKDKQLYNILKKE